MITKNLVENCTEALALSMLFAFLALWALDIVKEVKKRKRWKQTKGR